MKIFNSNILGRFLFSGHNKYLGYASLPLLVLTVMLWGISQFVNAASSHSVDSGIEAFKQGDFTRAKILLSQYVDANTADTSQVKVYMFAMEETPTVNLSTNTIQDIIQRSAEGDVIFKTIEARLHLLGVHPHANKQEGLKILDSLANDQGYAAYTLGLYFEGALDGIKRDEAKAKSWYEAAKDHHYVQAMIKLYALTKGGEIRGSVTADQSFHQIPNQRKAPKATEPLSLQQTFVHPLTLPSMDFNLRSGKVRADKTPDALVQTLVETKDNPNPTPVMLPLATPVEADVVCREDPILNRHPQTILEDALPDLHQQPIQNKIQTHPINPIEQLTRSGLTTSYPLLGSAAHWGDFLHQRKMRKLS